MAIVKPFKAFRYTAKAGDPARLVTQPYDKISPEMQARYLENSPFNLVRIILGERFASDDDKNNVYTRAADYLENWIQEGILAQDSVPAFYAYSQEFEVPDTGERAVRKGFIGLGKIEDYSAKVVHRHEQTLSGPKKDRLNLLRAAHAHFGQIFMLYPDPEQDVDRLLDGGKPLMDVLDDYQARHRLSAITDPATIEEIQELLAPRKLLIADGHHRYETALAFRNESRGIPSAGYVMMTFVNMHSPGLKILATHRVLRNLDGFDGRKFLEHAANGWTVTTCESVDGVRKALQIPQPDRVRIAAVTRGAIHLLERPREEEELDVPVLHQEILGDMLGIGEEAVREEKYITYVRGIDAAVAQVKDHSAQIAFLLEPTPMEDMARIAFAGGVMPQKSTDFYPKLLSGVTIYRL
ncbi:MAG: DUF1015 domain-containing protein [Bryobacterales bacterium]|nr:DUF1015 domain-containing protein [Bryobacterales bacterium]MBV9400040.1 DUF1015 domain-containing protein [Bryobacterales bacterium]